VFLGGVNVGDQIVIYWTRILAMNLLLLGIVSVAAQLVASIGFYARMSRWRDVHSLPSSMLQHPCTPSRMLQGAFVNAFSEDCAFFFVGDTVQTFNGHHCRCCGVWISGSIGCKADPANAQDPARAFAKSQRKLMAERVSPLQTTFGSGTTGQDRRRHEHRNRLLGSLEPLYRSPSCKI
jgi:hypothetical protein